MCKIQGELRILFHQNHGNTFFVNLLKDSSDLLNYKGSQPQRWFIQHEQARPRHQCPTYGEHLLFTATHGFCHLFAACLKHWKMIENFIQISLDSLLIGSEKCAQVEIFQNRESRENSPAFRDMGNAQLENF